MGQSYKVQSSGFRVIQFLISFGHRLVHVSRPRRRCVSLDFEDDDEDEDDFSIPELLNAFRVACSGLRVAR